VAVAATLLLAIWAIASWSTSRAAVFLGQPPFAVGGIGDVVRILAHNLLVLALHAMACVAGFIAGSSLPLQARYHTGRMRAIRERGRPLAIGLVVCATCASLSLQAVVLGTGVARVAAVVQRAPGVVLLALASCWEVYAAPHVVSAVLAR
jgi:hypothetical protein